MVQPTIGRVLSDIEREIEAEVRNRPPVHEPRPVSYVPPRVSAPALQMPDYVEPRDGATAIDRPKPKKKWNPKSPSGGVSWFADRFDRAHRDENPRHWVRAVPITATRRRCAPPASHPERAKHAP